MVVLIPAYQPNEELIKLTHLFIEKTDFSLVVVNDGSSPEKDEIFSQLPEQVTLLKHAQNCGKGRAMKTGMAYIQDHYPANEALVVVDADGQHILPDVLKVCDALADHPDSLVLGSRLFTGKVPFRSKFGNTITRYVFAAASGQMVHDTQTGLRAFPVSLIPQLLEFNGDRYEYEMNMLLGAAKQGIPMHEVYIETVYLDEENSSSHFHPLRDSMRIYGCIFKFIAPSLLKFGSSSLAAFVIDASLLLLLEWLFGMTALTASVQLLLCVVIARICSSIFNFFVNQRFVFKKQDDPWRSLLKYYALVVVILGLNYGLMYILKLLIGLHTIVAKLLVEVILFLFSYTMQQLFVFKSRKNRSKNLTTHS